MLDKDHGDDGSIIRWMMDKVYEGGWIKFMTDDGSIFWSMTDKVLMDDW